MNDRKAREDAARFASFGDTVSTRLISLGESKSNNPNIITIATKVPDMLDVMQTITTVNKMLKNINSTSFQTMRDQLSNYPASELSNDTTLAAAIDQMLPILDGILSRIKSNNNKIPTEGEEKQ